MKLLIGVLLSLVMLVVGITLVVSGAQDSPVNVAHIVIGAVLVFCCSVPAYVGAAVQALTSDF